MDLDDAQEDYFDAQLDVLLYWHRTTQLPVYAKSLREMDRALNDGATIEEMFILRGEFEGWWKNIQATALPMMSELLYSATDAQLDQFEAQYAKDTLKYTKPYAKLTPEQRRKRWAKEYREGMEYFIGSLTKEQKQLIASFRDRYAPDEGAWADYRRRYSAELVAMVRRRGSYAEFTLALRDLTLQRERFYGESYQATLDANSTVYAQVSVALLNLLNPKQREHLTKKLTEIAEDFTELSTDLPANVPVAGCLVTCS